jgi:hypothetical protein
VLQRCTPEFRVLDILEYSRESCVIQSKTTRPFYRFAISIVIAVIALSTVTRSPRFAYFRTVDMLLLFASGVAFGAAIVELLVALRQRREP